MKTRILLWKLHRWIGLACAMPFALLAVTGLGLLICHATETAAGPRLDRPVTTLAGVDVAISALRARYGDTSLGLILPAPDPRSEEHTSELQSLMRISYAVFCLKKKKKRQRSRQRSARRITTTLITT